MVPIANATVSGGGDTRGNPKSEERKGEKRAEKRGEGGDALEDGGSKTAVETHTGGYYNILLGPRDCNVRRKSLLGIPAVTISGVDNDHLEPPRARALIQCAK